MWVGGYFKNFTAEGDSSKEVIYSFKVQCSPKGGGREAFLF